jgi:hypothetical protein
MGTKRRTNPTANIDSFLATASPSTLQLAESIRIGNAREDMVVTVATRFEKDVVNVRGGKFGSQIVDHMPASAVEINGQNVLRDFDCKGALGRLPDTDPSNTVITGVEE